MTDLRKVVKKIRHVGVPPIIYDPRDLLIAEAENEVYRADLWESDIITVRDRNFEKARLVRQQNIEARNLAREEEESRQNLIDKTRLKNLRKARRVLAKQRGE